ncbi:MAG: Hpt domain-containing protein, partial [Proteobacteria bacterium]|nr:Hpt domain-containing protein [Pseudomonadota bacterium]
MSFPMDEMDEIINDFIAEAQEDLESLDQKFVQLEKTPGDTALLNDIFRAVHTIKGAAGFLGFEDIVKVAHSGEDILNKLRKGEMSMTPLIMDGILSATDIIGVMINNLKEHNNKKEKFEPVVKALEGLLAGGGKEAAKAKPGKKAAAKKVEAKPAKKAAAKKAEPKTAKKAVKGKA